MHTYVPKHPLKLLYIDGLSAGKTTNGTLDTQDVLLLNLINSDIANDLGRAQGLCNLSSTLWENRIDGILRMEGGFEIILCNFEKHLETKDIMPVVYNEWRGSVMNLWVYFKAITKRYHGIGGGRAVLDYENFVSAFEYPELDLWNNDVISDMEMPRLQKAKPRDLQKVKDAVTAMILSPSSGEGKSVNWQEVIDMLVTRYSGPLHSLHTNPELRSSREAFTESLSNLLRPFIDYTSRNSSAEILRCISQSIPQPAFAQSLAYKAIHTVAFQLCKTLISAHGITIPSSGRTAAEPAPPSSALQLVDSLKEYLQWTSWKECKGCSDEEICVVPIWPMGNHEQHAVPRCQGRSVKWAYGYWGIGRMRALPWRAM